MILWILVCGGILTFLLGIYFLIKNYKHGKYSKGYGLLSYLGLAMAVLGVILLMEPVFKSLPGNLSNMAPLGIAMCIFIIAGKLLLKPTFLKNKK